MGDDVKPAVNASDIEHLEKSLDEVKKEVKDTPSKEDFRDLKGTVEKVVTKGNGNKPLLSRVSSLETKFHYIIAGITGITNFLGAIALKVFTRIW